MERFKKIFAAGVIFVTVLSMSVVVAPEAGAVASAGDLIKMSGLSSVYYLAANGKRYVFPNEQTYFSWYSDFSGVVTIPQSELESYPLGANVTVRPGTKLVKITTNPKVYAVTANGTLVGIPDEATAATLYGANWNRRIIDVPDAFFTNYTTSASTVSATAYPQGSLVKFGTSADVFYINADGTASKIASEAVLTANRFKLADVITATIAKPTEGVAISAAVATLTDTSSGAGGTVGAGTGLTVALASDTPASATVITDTTATTGNGQANVSFLKVNFTAAADGDVMVKILKFKRTGISADIDMDGLFLYDGATRLTDSSSISSNYVTFNNTSGLFTVTKGTTKSITLTGDMNYAATSGKTIGMNLVAATDVTTNGAAVSGSFPVTGNLMSTANATDLGKASFGTFSNSYPTAADTSISPANDQEIFSFRITSTNQELKVERLKLTAVGSIQLTDLRNFKLLVSGAQVGSTVAALATGNVVEFDFSAAPYVIPKGGQKTFSLRGDIAGGSTRTFYWSFQNQNDIIIKDASYNVYIEPYAAGTFSIIKPSGNYLISTGALAISRASNSPTADVAVDGTNVPLAIFDFTASGEDIKVGNMDVQANIVGGANGGILNGKVYIDDVQVGTTKNLTEAIDVNFTFGSTFIVKAGTTAKVKIIGDIKTTTSTSYAGTETVAITIGTGSSNAQRLTSLGTFNAPASDTTANTLTITSAAVTVSMFSGFGNQTVVAGTNNVKLGSFVVTAGASEGVTVNSITIALSADESNSSTITRMYMKDHATGAALGEVKSSLSTSNVYSVSFSLTASTGKVIDLYGDLKSGANAGPWIANIDVDGTGSSTGLAVSATAANIQTMTLGSGSLSVTAGSMPDAAIVLAGSTGNKVAQLTFSATNDGFTIDKLQLKTANNFASSTAAVYIKYKNKEGVMVTSPTQTFISDSAQTNSTSTFASLTIYVPADDDAKVDVYLDMTSLSSNGVSGANGTIILDWNNGFNAVQDSGGSPTTTIGSADVASNSFYNRKSKPTFAKQTLTGAPSTGNALFKFTVVADNRGDIEIKQLGFTITTNGADVSSLYLWDTNAGVQLTDTAVSPVITGDSVKLVVGRAAGTAGAGSDDDIITVGSADNPIKTYEVRGTVDNYTSSASDSITLRFKTDTTATSTTSAGTAIAQNNFNVWSDRSVTSSHSTATADWTGGYLLKDMTQLQQLP